MKNRLLIIVLIAFSAASNLRASSFAIECDTFIQKVETLTACDTSSVYFNIYNFIGSEIELDSNIWIINKQETVVGDEIEFLDIDAVFLLEFVAVDTAGCIYEGEVTVYNLPLFEVIYNDSIRVCKGSKVSLQDIVFINGTDSVSYFLFGGEIDANTEFTFVDTSTLELKIKSVEGCVRNISFTAVPVVPAPYDLEILSNDITCIDQPNFIIDASISNLKYNWYSNNGFEAEGDSIDVEIAGQYFLIATDSLGCTTTFSSSVAFDLLVPKFDINFDNILCDENSGFITIIKEDTSATVTFYTPEQDTIIADSIIIDKPGEYLYDVTGTNGCTQSGIVLIKEIITPIDYFLDTLLCFGDTLFLSTNYDFADSTAWVDAQFVDSLAYFTEPGIKQLALFNDGGCEDTLQFELTFTTIMPQLTFLGEYRFCEGSDAFLYVENDYTSVIWNDTLVSDTFKFTEQGFIKVEVFNDFGCKLEKEIFIFEVPSLELELNELRHDDCSGNGLIDLNIIGGFPPFKPLWNTGDTTLTLDSLEIGNYSVVVTDSLGCETEGEYYIDKIYEPLIIPNAHWFVLNYVNNNPEASEFFAYVIRDEKTTINGKEYYIVYKQIFHHDFNPLFPSPPYFIKNQSIYAYIREDISEQKVYAKLVDKFDLCEDEDEKLWYDFSTKVGDDLANICVYNINKEVACENIQFIDFYDVKRKFLEPGLIEGFGTTYGIFDHDAYKSFIPGVSKNFIDYCIGPDGDCNIDYTLAIDENSLNSQLMQVAYQNGSTLIKTANKGTLKLHNVSGANVKKFELESQEWLNLSAVVDQKGVYILKFHSIDNEFDIEKVLIY
jgi:hypothetical protein